MLQQPGSGSVTGFVESNRPFLLLSDDLIFLFQTANDPVNGIQEVLLFYLCFMMPCSDKRRLVAEVGDISTGKTRCLLGQKIDVYIFAVELQRLEVNLKDLLTLVDIRHVYVDLAVKASCTKQSAVKHIRPVGRSQDNYT